jgi:hypothetical protein
MYIVTIPNMYLEKIYLEVKKIGKGSDFLIFHFQANMFNRVILLLSRVQNVLERYRYYIHVYLFGSNLFCPFSLVLKIKG